MKKFLKPKFIITTIFILIPVYYLSLLLIIKQELFAENPKKQKFASIDSPLQRVNQQYCTGIYITPKNTWLISRSDSDYHQYIQPKDSYNLNNLLPIEESNTSNYFGFQKDNNITYISKLDQNGKFKEVARLEGIGCFVTPPNGESILILTDIQTPYNFDEQHQMAVLRSDDQGQTWLWQKEGFFMPVYFQAWTLKPTFFNDNNIWVWKQDNAEIDEIDEIDEITHQNLKKEKPSGLSFSSDLGKTTEMISTPTPLLIDINTIKNKISDNVEWQSEDTGTVKTFITQWKENEAILWISQTFRYSKPESHYVDGYIYTTTQVKLQRKTDQWKIEKIQFIEGLAINEIVKTDQGKFIAIQSRNNQEQEQIAELQPDNLSWKVHGELPNPFSPFNGSTHVEYIWSARNTLVVGTYSHHQFYKIFRPFKWFSSESAGDVSAFGIYATNDLGKSWHRLAIEAPNGVIGINQKTNEIYWAEGAWYDNADLNIYKHSLK